MHQAQFSQNAAHFNLCSVMFGLNPLTTKTIYLTMTKFVLMRFVECAAVILVGNNSFFNDLHSLNLQSLYDWDYLWTVALILFKRF